MDIDDFFNQLIKLKDRELEQKVWEIWLAKYPHMTEKTYVSYEDMLSTAKQKEVKHDIPANGMYVDQAFF
jgi:hypothetical protein